MFDVCYETPDTLASFCHYELLTLYWDFNEAVCCTLLNIALKSCTANFASVWLYSMHILCTEFALLVDAEAITTSYSFYGYSALNNTFAWDISVNSGEINA